MEATTADSVAASNARRVPPVLSGATSVVLAASATFSIYFFYAAAEVVITDGGPSGLGWVILLLLAVPGVFSIATFALALASKIAAGKGGRSAFGLSIASVATAAAGIALTVLVFV